MPKGLLNRKLRILQAKIFINGYCLGINLTFFTRQNFGRFVLGPTLRLGWIVVICLP